MEEAVWEAQGSANDMWDEMTKGIKKLAEKRLNKLRGLRHKGKESWWWYANMQDNIKVERECYKD